MSNYIFEQVDANGKTGFEPRLPELKPRIVLHTTEVISPTADDMRTRYKNHKYPPHVWCSFSESNSWDYKKKWGSAVRDKKSKVRHGYDLVCQRLPLNRSAYSISAPVLKKAYTDRNGKIYPKGFKVETNHASAACLQVEIEGWAGSVMAWEDSLYEKIGRQVVAPFAKWIKENVDPSFTLIPFSDKIEAANAYGMYAVDKKGNVKSGSQRMSYIDWLNSTGGEHGNWTICAHSNSPMNKHWDGPFDLAKICDYADDELGNVNLSNEDVRDKIAHAKVLLDEALGILNG